MNRESELAGARADRDVRAGELRSVENSLAGVTARLGSLEELDAARAEYGDGARLILAEAPTSEIGQLGSVADYLEVDGQYERAVEACAGEILQHVVVRTHDQAEAGIRLAEAHHAGRVGFVVADAADGRFGGFVVPQSDHAPMAGVRCLLDVVRVSGPAADAIRAVLAEAWIADDFGAALEAACRVSGPIATPQGEVFHGLVRVEGGARAEARGILATKREIKELRERAEEQRLAAERLREEVASLDRFISSTESAILVLQGEQHRQEKAAIGFELQAANADNASERIARKQDQIGTERRTSEEELRAQDARYEEAQASIARIEVDQRAADAQLNDAQRRLFEARERMQAQSSRTAEAKAVHAGLVERASALSAEVGRLEEAGRELESRAARRTEDLLRNSTRREELRTAVAEAERALDAGVRLFDELRDRVKSADERSASLREQFNAQEVRIREARRLVEHVRAEAAQFDVARATAEADLTHLAATCQEAVQATLEEVSAEVDELERAGALASPRPVDDAPEPAEVDDEGDAGPESAAAGVEVSASASPAAPMTADEMVADLRAKIDRMGAVNMMAIDQFDDLESRHTFLTTQRKDLIDSIAATNDAIKKIDKTTKERFREAFAAINENFARHVQNALRWRARRPGPPRRERSSRERHRHHRAAARQASPERAAAVGRRKSAHGDGADVRDLQIPSEPVLPAGRNRRAARRRQHRTVRRDAAGHAGRDAVHPDHPQPEDDGDRRSPLRGHDGRAGGVEVDFSTTQLIGDRAIGDRVMGSVIGDRAIRSPIARSRDCPISRSPDHPIARWRDSSP